MPVVNVFCCSYCGAEEVVRSVIEKTGYTRLDDAAVVLLRARGSILKIAKSGKPSEEDLPFQ